MELTELDKRRGRFQRGEWMRMATLFRIPPNIPSINLEAWVNLARLSGNFNQAQALLNRTQAGHHASELLQELRCAVDRLRRDLIGASS